MLIEWDMEGCRGMLFPVLVNIVLENRPNILADLAGVITGTGAEIDGIKTEENIDGTTSASVTLGVQGRVHLAEVIKKVRIMPGVAKVSRQRQQ
jgi:guanosine-3',5'-bis(diphosphate) 3'-pyrophosphohydrolase